MTCGSAGTDGRSDSDNGNGIDQPESEENANHHLDIAQDASVAAEKSENL